VLVNELSDINEIKDTIIDGNEGRCKWERNEGNKKWIIRVKGWERKKGIKGRNKWTRMGNLKSKKKDGTLKIGEIH
jgi:hypothetical protein